MPVRDSDATALVPIGTFAEVARVTVKALRHYHAIGILTPARIDEHSGYRYYSWDQLGDALCITTLRGLGTPLDRIKAHLVGGVALHQVLADERVRLQRQAARAESALAVLDTLRTASELPTVKPDVVEWPDRRALTISGHAHGDTLGADAATLIGRLLDRAAVLGLDTGHPVLGEYPLRLAGTVTMRVRLAVPEPPPAGLELDTVRGGRLARVVHVGPLETLSLGYYGLLRWLLEKRQRPAGPVYERYVDDPSTTPPGRLRTEILHRLTE